MKSIPSLDGIRALSVMIVFVSHAGLGELIPGGLGVTVFFFLSGFLITSLLRVEFARTAGVNIRAFYLRRVLRLGPPLLVTLAIGYGVWFAGVQPRGSATVAGFLAQLFYFANYFSVFFDPGHTQVPYGTGVLWSLAVEEHFYLIFPIAFLLLARRCSLRTMMYGFVATCIAVLLWRCHLASQPGFRVDRTFLASDTRLDSILFGSVFALAFDVTRLPSPQDRRPLRDGLLFAGGAGIMLLTLLVRGEYFRETLRYTLQGVALMPIFYCAIVYAESLWFQPLNWAWVRRIGVYSYSIYLIHYIVLASLQHVAPFRDSTLLVFAASCAITLLFAELVERFLESRLRELRRRIH